MLPATNESLRILASSRDYSTFKIRSNVLSSAIEVALSRVFQAEIDYQRKTEALKADLNARYDFTVRGAFDLMDTLAPVNKIDRCEIRNFVDLYVRWLSEAELDAIVRRCDTDGDEALSYLEFSEVIRGINPVLTSPSKTVTHHFSSHHPVVTHEYSPLRRSASPVRNEVVTTTYHSPSRYSPSRYDFIIFKFKYRLNVTTTRYSPGRVEITTRSPGRVQTTTHHSPLRSFTHHSPRRVEVTRHHSPGRVEVTRQYSPGRVDVTRHHSPGRVEVTTHHSPGRVDITTRHSPIRPYTICPYPGCSPHRSTLIHRSPVREASPLRSSTFKAAEVHHVSHTSPYRTHAFLPRADRRDSPLRTGSPLRATTAYSPIRRTVRHSPGKVEIEETKVECSPRYSRSHNFVETVHHSPIRRVTTTTHIRNASPLRGYEEDELAESFKELIDLENRLESAKESLALRPDFTIHDAFRIFDFSNLARVGAVDIKEAFSEFSIYITLEEARLVSV